MNKKKKEAKNKELFTFKNAIILIVIIMLIAVFRAATIPTETSKTNLEKEAKVMLNILADEDGKVSLVNSNELVEEKIENLNEMGYEELKNIIGIKNDFCIYFEDITGNVVQIDGINPGIGSEKISINNKPCK
tara:strand:+ start:375 stop:773 length:399 start_codon:yes stop_codon:yes gene_type:complete